MSDTRPELPTVLLGPDSGRKVAEHIELSGKTGELPDPRDEAVGLLRRIVSLLDGCPFLCANGGLHYEARSLLARIDGK